MNNVDRNKVNEAKNYEWELLYAMPNLNLNKPFESEFIAIVPFDDERLNKIISTEKIAEILLTNFKNEAGKQVKPSALIWKKDTPGSIRKNDAIVAFRNSLAISSLLHGCCRAVNSENIFEPIFADYFDFYPVAPNKRGNGFIISTPATLAIWSKVDKFYGHTYPHISIYEQLKANPDEYLAEKILRQWKIRYISPGIDSWYTRLLFRSFEVAYQALMSPFHHSTIHEYETNLSLWTSAFEILVQKKGGKNVGYKDVLKLLGNYKWGMKKLDDRRFKIYKERNLPRGNLVQKLYREIYDTRNAFFHGNPVTESCLYPFRNKARPSLFQLAPTIYWVALTVYLPDVIARNKVERAGKAIKESFNISDYIQALLAAIGINLEDI